jgi:hypothetical protein
MHMRRNPNLLFILLSNSMPFVLSFTLSFALFSPYLFLCAKNEIRDPLVLFVTENSNYKSPRILR